MVNIKKISTVFIKKITFKTKLIFFFSLFVIISVFFTYMVSNNVFLNIIIQLLDNFSIETVQNKVNLLDMNLKQYDMLLRDIIANQEIQKVMLLERNDTYENAVFYNKFNSTSSNIAIQLQTSDLRSILLRSKYNIYNSPTGVVYTGSSKNNSGIEEYDNTLYKLIRLNDGRITFLNTEDYQFSINKFYRCFAMGRLFKETNGNEIGYTIAFINYDFFNNIFDGTSLSRNSTLCIFSGDKKIVYSQSNNTDNINFLQDNFGELPRGKNSLIVRNNGTPFLVTYYTSGYSNWTLVYMVPISELFGGIQFNRNFSILFCILFIVLSIMVAVYISASMTKPIKGLMRTMRGISSGDMSLRADIHGGMEIKELCIHFNRMIEEINSLIRENDKKQKALVKTELTMLQAQINPHFLYNTLNSIRWISIINKQDQIKNLIDSLSNLIMNTFRNTDVLISIEDELSILESYICLMKVRYSNFNVKVDIEDNDRKLKILKFILQPFIENSIIYGFNKIDYIGMIKISFKNENGALHIAIADSGTGISDEVRLKIAQQKDEGNSLFNSIGISNVNKRIQLHYGSNYGVEICNNEPTGIIIRIVLPLVEGY